MNIELDEQQLEAIGFLKYHILNKTKVVCLLGAGGTGKTSIIHKLLSEDLNNGELYFTATTNKAASIMRKDIKSAKTMHSTISKFVPTELYLNIENYFICEGGVDEATGKEVELTKETLEFLKTINQKADELLEHNNVDEFFRNYEIDGYDPLVFSHYETAQYAGGVCVVDESSMLPEKSIYREEDGKLKLQTIGLDILEGIFDTVVLVGDDMQLPPINGKSSFDGKPQFHLTKNYRSELDLLRLLQYAREGKSLELFQPKKGENIRIINKVPEKMYKDTFKEELEIAHIVYTNKTRREVTRSIRGQDGIPKEGEPIVYYGKNINDEKNHDYIAKNEIGEYKDGMGIWEYHHEFVNFDLFDEYPSKKKYSKFRYGYALTCHSAQGSSFDYIVVHLYDMPGFIDLKTQHKWCYTAVSRARKGVILVR